MKDKSALKDCIVIGLAMFAIFFGAGNLIFPPQIGLVSGKEFLPAIVGIALSGILFPMMAVAAVGNVGLTIEDLMRHAHPKLHNVYMVACILIICFGTMPRCGSVSYEIGLLGMFPSLPPVSKWIFLFIFFLLSFLVAVNRSGFIDIIGKFITPVLALTLLAIIVMAVTDPLGVPENGIVSHPFSNAFITGINTGDVLTGIICAGIIITSIRGKGYLDGREQKRMIFRVTAVAFVLLLVIYGGLCYLGATGTSFFPADTDNTALLVGLVRQLAGYGGIVVLSIAIIFACFTTAAGMIATASDWVVTLSKNRLPYRPVVLVMTLLILFVSSAGVSSILKISGPLFVLLFPMSVIFTFLGCFKKFIPNDGVWKGSVYMSMLIGVCQALQTAVENGLFSADFSYLNRLLSFIPLSELGFTWLIPSVAGGVIGGIIWHLLKKESVTDEIDRIAA